MEAPTGVTITCDDGQQIRMESAVVSAEESYSEGAMLPDFTVTCTTRRARYITTPTTQNLPDKVIHNRNALILFKDDKKVVVKRREDDVPNARVGFLEAYFQMTSGLSKTQANKYLEKFEPENELKVATMTIELDEKQLKKFKKAMRKGK